MKYFLFLIALGASLACISQPKFEVGLTAEGLLCMKSESTIPIRIYGERSNWGSGFGTYISMPIGWRFSWLSGINYRYSEYQKGIPYWEKLDYGSILSGYTWIKSSRNYLVVPLNLQFLVTKKMYITGGMEACHLFGYNYLERGIEYNWTLGLGHKTKKLSWELKLIKGLDEQLGAHHNEAGVGINDKWTRYKTNMLQLRLSYPLWQK